MVKTVRVTHRDGDEELFEARAGAILGRVERADIVLPSPDIAREAGHLIDTPEGFRFVSTTPQQKSQLLHDGVDIGPFHVVEGEARADVVTLGGPWGCRFRPRVLSAHGSLRLLAVENSLAQGRALAVDVDDAVPTLYEAITWRPQDQSDTPWRETFAAIAAGRFASDDAAGPSHLLRPDRVIETDDLRALLFAFIPSVQIYQLAALARGARGFAPDASDDAKRAPLAKVPREVAVALQAQIGRLLIERDRAGATIFPLEWTQMRLGIDGVLRLPVAGPWSWRDRDAQGNVGALVAAAAAMMGAALDDPRPTVGGMASMLVKGGLAFFDDRSPPSTIEPVRGWLAGVAAGTLARQTAFQELSELIED